MEDAALSGICWMCGGSADSREHKFKKSDLVRRYGRQPYREIGGVSHVVEGTEREVQGPSAKILTYDPVICFRCNNTVSQPWDEAYRQFERWVFDNTQVVLKRRFILLEDVFGSDLFSAACPALYKYFAKAFGCHLAHVGEQVPQDIVELLQQDYFRTMLRLAFSVNKSAFIMQPEDRDQFLGIGGLNRLDSRSLGKQAKYVWHMQVGWLCIRFFYDDAVPAGLGAPWTSDSACLYLCEFEPITLDEAIETARTSGAPSLADLEALRDRGGIIVE